MKEKVLRITVRKMIPIRTILSENGRGIQVVRMDNAKHSVLLNRQLVF